MPGELSTFLCLAMVLAESAGGFVNDWDQPFNFNCPSGQIISYISSVHDNKREDRRWEFHCRGAGNTQSCSDSGYVNSFDGPVVFKCPGDHVIAGVNSYHENKHEDRRFAFQCCNVQGRKPRDCYITGNVNDWDGKLTLSVPEGKAIKGAYSHHNNRREDRLWQFEICTL